MMKKILMILGLFGFIFSVHAQMSRTRKIAVDDATAQFEIGKDYWRFILTNYTSSPGEVVFEEFYAPFGSFVHWRQLVFLGYSDGNARFRLRESQLESSAVISRLRNAENRDEEFEKRSGLLGITFMNLASTARDQMKDSEGVDLFLSPGAANISPVSFTVILPKTADKANEFVLRSLSISEKPRRTGGMLPLGIEWAGAKDAKGRATPRNRTVTPPRRTVRELGE